MQCDITHSYMYIIGRKGHPTILLTLYRGFPDMVSNQTLFPKMHNNFIQDCRIF